MARWSVFALAASAVACGTSEPLATADGKIGTVSEAVLLSGGKTVSVSSVENAGTPGAYAVDGNAGTRWSTLFSDPQWISVDLGATQSINRIVLNWEGAYSNNYKILTSNTGGNCDPATWTQIHSDAAANGGIDDFAVNGLGRHVCMYSVTRGTGYGVSLWEFEVHGSDTGGTVYGIRANANGKYASWRSSDNKIVADSTNIASNDQKFEIGANADGTKWIKALGNSQYCRAITATDVRCDTASNTGAGAKWTQVAGPSTGSVGFQNGLTSQYLVAEGGGNDPFNANRGAVGGWEMFFLDVPGGGCTPACSGKVCGSDGCGGVCGTCASGSTCNASGQCEGAAACGSVDLTFVTNLGSIASSGTAAQAFDNDIGSRWESAHGVDPQWIQIDLGSVKHVNRVRIDWEAANARDYTVQVSSDGSTGWSTLATKTNMALGNHRIDDLTGLSGTGRFLRVNGTARNLNYGYSIWEMDVFGDSNASCSGVGGGPACTKNGDCPAGQLCANGTACVTPASVFSPGSTGVKSFKRGIPFHFSGWSDSRGAADLDEIKSGITWYYNWGAGPIEGTDGLTVKNHASINKYNDATNGVEFVPMIWGYGYGLNHASAHVFGTGTPADCNDTNNDKKPDGACFRVDNKRGGDYCVAQGYCSSGYSDTEHNPGHPCYECLHELVTYDELVARIPAGARYLLHINEPNFYEQASMSPAEAAAMWKFGEKVAADLGLQLVSPAVNYCGQVPGAGQKGTLGPAECIEALPHRTFGTRKPDMFSWLDEFYFACQGGKNGRSGGAGGGYTGPGAGDCKVDFNAYHVYATGYNNAWTVELIRKWRDCRAGQLCDTAVNTGADTMADRVRDDAYVQTHAAKPYWATEFQGEWSGGDHEAMKWMREDLSAFETSAEIFRYSYFMLRVADGMSGLRWGDLTCAMSDAAANPTGAEITNIGLCYIKHPVGAAASITPGTANYVAECNEAAIVETTQCCTYQKSGATILADHQSGLCYGGWVKECAADADCATSGAKNGNFACSAGRCLPKTCYGSATCANGYICSGTNDGNADGDCSDTGEWCGSCRESCTVNADCDEPGYHCGAGNLCKMYD